MGELRPERVLAGPGAHPVALSAEQRYRYGCGVTLVPAETPSTWRGWLQPVPFGCRVALQFSLRDEEERHVVELSLGLRQALLYYEAFLGPAAPSGPGEPGALTLGVPSPFCLELSRCSLQPSAPLPDSGGEALGRSTRTPQPCGGGG